jgi:hypothetical protein
MNKTEHAESELENEDNNLTEQRWRCGSSAGNFPVKCRYGSRAVKLGRNKSSSHFTQEERRESTKEAGSGLPIFPGVSLPLHKASFSMSWRGKKSHGKAIEHYFPRRYDLWCYLTAWLIKHILPLCWSEDLLAVPTHKIYTGYGYMYSSNIETSVAYISVLFNVVSTLSFYQNKSA